jgi:hypothetical protein
MIGLSLTNDEKITEIASLTFAMTERQDVIARNAVTWRSHYFLGNYYKGEKQWSENSSV